MVVSSPAIGVDVRGNWLAQITVDRLSIADRASMRRRASSSLGRRGEKREHKNAKMHHSLRVD